MIPVEQRKGTRCFCSNEIVKERKLLVKDGSDFFFLPLFPKNVSGSFVLNLLFCKHLILPDFSPHLFFVAVIAGFCILFCNNDSFLNPKNGNCLKQTGSRVQLSYLDLLSLPCQPKALRLASAEETVAFLPACWELNG